MKKIILAAIAVLPFWSCSSDDSQPQPQQPTGTIPLVTKITTDGADGDNSDKTYLISYDENRRIKDVTVSGDANKTMHFTYTADGQIHTVATTGDDAGLLSTNYDNFMHLSQIAF